MELRNLERFTADEQALLSRAYAFAAVAHAHQRRVSGEPFLTHLQAVAQLLIDEFGADAQTVAAGLLHDSVEDTDVTLEDIEREFGPQIRFLVDAVTDYGKGDGNPHIETRKERDAYSHRKVEAYAAKDPRIYLIKIADRWHNLTTSFALREKSRERLSKEALEFHVPICRRLGFDKQALQVEMAAQRLLASVRRS